MIDVWKTVPNISYQQNVTVEELLTMTTACRDTPDVYVNFDNSIEAKTFGEGDLITVLKFPDCPNVEQRKASVT
jgi:hypothetical protein